jgi:hypothetical protein
MKYEIVIWIYMILAILNFLIFFISERKIAFKDKEKKFQNLSKEEKKIFKIRKYDDNELRIICVIISFISLIQGLTFLFFLIKNFNKNFLSISILTIFSIIVSFFCFWILSELEEKRRKNIELNKNEKKFIDIIPLNDYSETILEVLEEFYNKDKEKYDKWLNEKVIIEKELYYIFLSDKDIRNEILKKINENLLLSKEKEKKKLKNTLNEIILKETEKEILNKEVQDFKKEISRKEEKIELK